MAANKSERALVDEWRDVLALHARTTCELDRALHPYGLGASDFEVLDVLAEGAAEDGPGSWRVQELAGRVHLSQSALSRLIARLEKDGLVVRGMCAEDRRGVQVKLTEKGLARHAEVRPLQRDVLTRMLDESA
ncbi:MULTISPECIES: MarR family winged helix-turn-helix transcriptional regulator [unclassified Streptomyces]|uniref:MarR family winged helix-turn-helix transcriptional regulator n=1 Tax=unclassified Streptomyces TaxID=2593676 RepID=UPI001655A2A5|nr:MarR family transcriptional regulator [Streptomyces sp. CB02980]MCB8904573.1 MarR family transcriptional regulator [Streptomyces sp. CB02980]